MSPFDFCKSINEKNYIFQKEVDKKHYTSYIVNKSFSLFRDTLLLANEANMWSEMSPQQNYDFYFYSVSKKPRYTKWVKQDKSEDAVLLSERLSIRYDRAEEIMSILSEDELKTLKDEINIDGLRK